MRQQRTYTSRNRKVHLDELQDMIALHAGGGDQLAFADAEPLSGQALEALVPEVSLSEVRAFEGSGWRFVPQEQTANLPAQASKAKVFLRQGGQLALATNHLTVKFRDEVSRQEADEILRSHGCRTVEPLTFASGLFRVTLADGAVGDVLDIANALASSPLVEFAEPELIEFSGHR